MALDKYKNDFNNAEIYKKKRLKIEFCKIREYLQNFKQKFHRIGSKKLKYIFKKNYMEFSKKLTV